MQSINFDQDLLDAMRVDENYDEPILHQILRIAIYDEFGAYETYAKVIEKFGEVAPFTNIIIAEQRHFMALLNIMQKYGVAVPINDWADKIEIPSTLSECCELGVNAEIANIALYDHLISYASQYSDITDLFFRLQAASYNNHLKAFERCMQNYQSTNQTLDTFLQKQNMQTAMEQMDKISQLAAKIGSGEASPQEMLGMLENSNLSFIAGALLGAVGTAVFAQISKEKNEN